MLTHVNVGFENNNKMGKTFTGCIIASFILAGIFLSCTTTQEVPPKDVLQRDVLEYGDTNAYNQLRFYYFDADLLPYSIFMADKYQYKAAFSTIYHIMDDHFKTNNIEFDSATCQYVLYYIRKGVEQKDESCAILMCDAYLRGKMVEVDTSKAKECLLQVFPKEKVETLYWPHMMKRNDHR